MNRVRTWRTAAFVVTGFAEVAQFAATALCGASLYALVTAARSDRLPSAALALIITAIVVAGIGITADVAGAVMRRRAGHIEAIEWDTGIAP